MSAIISYENNSLEIFDFKHFPQDTENGNPHNTLFKMRVVSDDFSGIAPCECDIKEFRRFIFGLEEMYQFRKNTVVLDDLCYGSKALFSLDEIGHIIISGTIYGDAAIHSMKFEFDVDQTVFPSFIAELYSLIDEFQ